MFWMIKCQLANDIWILWMKNLIYDDDCASLPNYIMCARQSALLATTAESAFFFVRAFSLLCSALLLLHTVFSIVVGVSLWRAFVGFLSLFFTGGSRASCCERCVFFLFWKGVLRFGGTAGVKKAWKEQRKAGFRFVS
jgi:hypothetical protein